MSRSVSGCPVCLFTASLQAVRWSSTDAGVVPGGGAWRFMLEGGKSCGYGQPGTHAEAASASLEPAHNARLRRAARSKLGSRRVEGRRLLSGVGRIGAGGGRVDRRRAVGQGRRLGAGGVEEGLRCAPQVASVCRQTAGEAPECQSAVQDCEVPCSDCSESCVPSGRQKIPVGRTAFRWAGGGTTLLTVNEAEYVGGAGEQRQAVPHAPARLAAGCCGCMQPWDAAVTHHRPCRQVSGQQTHSQQQGPCR